MNDGKPADRLPILRAKADSIVTIGRSEDGPVALTGEEMVRHVFISGTTGSGKTELLLAIAAQTMAAGSGMVFIDGKGDATIFSRMHALAASFGRADDVLLINFSTAPTADAPADGIRSNVMDPFGTMGADMLISFMSGMMGSAETASAHDFWEERARGFLAALVHAHVDLRDAHGVPLTPSSLQQGTVLDAVVAMSTDKRLSETCRSALSAYLDSIPGYVRGSTTQNATALDQHGYLSMQLMRVLNMLTQSYGHIFDAGSADVDMADVLLNGRILVVLLPALEKGRAETMALGRLVVASIRQTMTTALAAPIETDSSLAGRKRAPTGEFPFVVVFDELAHYVSDGMSTMTSQARSLGFSMVFATQDVGTLMLANSKETVNILSNTSVKVVMRGEGDGTSGIFLPSGGIGPDGINALDSIEFEVRRLKFELESCGTRRKAAIQERISTLLERAGLIVESNPLWSVEDIVRSLPVGRFVAIQGSRYVVGEAAHVSPSIRTGPIRLRRGVELERGYDPNAVRIFYGSRESRSKLSCALASDPREFFGSVPCEMGPLYILSGGMPYEECLDAARSMYRSHLRRSDEIYNDRYYDVVGGMT